jgi:hypothetical protein
MKVSHQQRWLSTLSLSQKQVLRFHASLKAIQLVVAVQQLFQVTGDDSHVPASVTE